MIPLNYKHLSEAIPFEEDGKTLLSIGFHVTFYFGDGSTEDNRRAIVELFNEYNKLCGDKLIWQTHPTTFRWHKIKEKYSPENWVLKNPRNTAVWQITRHGGRSFDESSPYRIEALGYPAPDNRLSCFSVGFPFDWFADPHMEDPVKIFTRWANILKPWHGTAGLTVMPSLHRPLEMYTARNVYALMHRFPGLEYNSPNSHRLYLKDTIKGVNWLTIIQDDLVNHLGGIDVLTRSLEQDHAIQFHPYEGGLVIQAGPHPEIGDVKLGLTPKHYKTVNKLLKPIRAGEEHAPFLGFTAEQTQEWLARFD